MFTTEPPGKPTPQCNKAHKLQYKLEPLYFMREIFLLLWSLEMLVREEQGYKRLQVHPPLHMRGRRSPQRQGMQWWKLQEDRPRPPTQTPGTLKLWHILRYFCRSADSSHSNCGGPYNLSGHTEASTVSTGGPGGCAAPPGGQTHYSAM